MASKNTNKVNLRSNRDEGEEEASDPQEERTTEKPAPKAKPREKSAASSAAGLPKGMGHFVGPLTSLGTREWKAPDKFNGFDISGTLYEFRLPNARDYSRYLPEGLGNILENPTQLDPIIWNQNYVNPVVDPEDTSMWEQELLRAAYLTFLSNGG